MNELRCAVAFLQGREDGAYPTDEVMKRPVEEQEREAGRHFYEWLKTIPKELQFEVEDESTSLANAWADKHYERGFIAGARLMIQIMTGCTQVV